MRNDGTRFMAKALFGRASGLLGRFRAERSGVAALEFALIAPLLLCMYFVTMEVSQGVETNKKISRLGAMVADLVAQQSDTTMDNLTAIMQIGGAILQPYDRSLPKIIVSEIAIGTGSDPTATIVWSRKLEDGNPGQGHEPGDEVTVPESLRAEGSYLIRVEAILDYRPVITWAAGGKPALGLAAAFDGISMHETYNVRSRMGTQVDCKDCPKPAT